MSVETIITRCEELLEDLAHQSVLGWKAEHAPAKAIGYLPVYAPRELIHAAGMLPVGVLGGGDRLEIIKGDSYFQSYICHLPRSVIELGLNGSLDCLDGFLFPSTCDVIRNLSGMWKMLFPDRYVKYVDVPQNHMGELGGQFFQHELQTIRTDLEALRGGAPITDDDLRTAIADYNENRRLVRSLYALRSKSPWLVPTSECYLLVRAGFVLPVEDHSRMLEEYLEAVERCDDRKPLDNSRIVLSGSFCEQPPVGLLRTLERAGCYIVDDDLLLLSRWHGKDVSTGGDPLLSLCTAFLQGSVDNATVYDSRGEKGQQLVRSVEENHADGVVFCAPSFCDPALLDQPMLVSALERSHVPYTAFKYSENTGQFQVIREQAGTFSDSVKLWGKT
jgi:benzoyl-CoA reductase subunit C